jgi:hypothetical protein
MAIFHQTVTFRRAQICYIQVMEQNPTSPRPSTLRIFGKGFLDGAFNGALMTGIFALLSLPLGGIGLVSAGIMVLAPAIFVGIMSVKQAMLDAPKQTTGLNPASIPVASPAIAPSLTPTVMADAPEQAPRKSWVTQTGQQPESNRIQSIIRGALSDKDRASAILAARDAAASDTSLYR